MSDGRGSFARRVPPDGVYGCLAVAVVCAAWEGDDLGVLTLEIITYTVALWAFHVYARVVGGGLAERTPGNLWRWAKHEWPHLEAAFPALVVVATGWAAGWDPVSTSIAALWATALNLLLWQVALLLQRSPTKTLLILTLLVDSAFAVALVWLRLYVK